MATPMTTTTEWGDDKQPKETASTDEWRREMIEVVEAQSQVERVERKVYHCHAGWVHAVHERLANRFSLACSSRAFSFDDGGTSGACRACLDPWRGVQRQFALPLGRLQPCGLPPAGQCGAPMGRMDTLRCVRVRSLAITAFSFTCVPLALGTHLS